MTTPSSERIHATCVAIDGRGVLLCGPSGSGKSDLALRLIDRGATLVSDDYTIVTRAGAAAMAGAPATIRGKLEVRGVAIIDRPSVEQVKIALMLLLDEQPARLPEPETRLVAGVAIPAMAIAAFEASAAVKVELALQVKGS